MFVAQTSITDEVSSSCRFIGRQIQIDIYGTGGPAREEGSRDEERKEVAAV
jgi:hypothetical protein